MTNQNEYHVTLDIPCRLIYDRASLELNGWLFEACIGSDNPVSGMFDDTDSKLI